MSASYYINDNWAVELWGAADKFNHRVNADGVGKIGTVEQQPIAISGQYHFGQADNVFRPFVGVGYYESNFSNEKIDAASATGQHVGLDTAKGVIGTVGVDMNINSTWFARADARYMRSRPNCAWAARAPAASWNWIRGPSASASARASKHAQASDVSVEQNGPQGPFFYA